MIAKVGAPVKMGLRMSFQLRDLKEPAMFGGGECQRFLKQRPERPAKPVVRGNIEPTLFSREGRRTEFPAHQVPEDNFLPRALNFQSGRERIGEFHDPVIEKWRSHLDRMSHAGTVDFGQDVIGKKILLIESQECLQVVARPGQFLQHRVERWRQHRL